MEKSCSVFLTKNDSIVINHFTVRKGPTQSGIIRLLGSNASPMDIGEAVCKSLEAFKEYPLGFDTSSLDALPFLKKEFNIKSWNAFNKTVLHGFSVGQENDIVLIYPLLKSGGGYVFDNEKKQYLPLDRDAIGRYFLSFRSRIVEAVEKRPE